MVLAYTGQHMKGHYYAWVGELHSCGLVKQSEISKNHISIKEETKGKIGESITVPGRRDLLC